MNDLIDFPLVKARLMLPSDRITGSDQPEQLFYSKELEGKYNGVCRVKIIGSFRTMYQL